MFTFGKGILYLRDEFVSNERLFDNSRVADFLKCGIVRIPRHKQHWKRWKLGMHFSSYIHSIHAGHCKIQHDQIDTCVSA